MSRVTQSRAQTEANAKLLRSLVKSPDNKVCVDCKKNDPRWASWNLGCFLCIRCSGIHRSMGTHISKVKSIDLDIWTHEQMESVQRWGNRRCNLFWEAHLKKGHVPPEHKIESFIRSKYESRRWAREGDVPSDPSVLDAGEVESASGSGSGSGGSGGGGSGGGGSGSGGGAKQVAREPEGGVANKSVNVDLLDDPSPSSAPTTVAKPAPPTAASIPTPTPTPTTAPTKPNAGGGIFDLDWHDPTPTTNTTTAGGSSGGGTKAKNDIMSLFAAKPVVPTPSTNGGEGFGDFTSFSSNPVPSTTTSLGALNASFNRLDLTSNDKPTTNTNPWNSSNTTTTTTASGGLFDTQHVWGSTTTTAATGSANKDDAFADIWGDFK